MTTGEYRVGITFNPGGNETVSKVKTAAAALIDMTEKIDDKSNSEVGRLKALAMTYFEIGAMWAVKAATKPGK